MDHGRVRVFRDLSDAINRKGKGNKEMDNDPIEPSFYDDNRTQVESFYDDNHATDCPCEECAEQGKGHSWIC